MSAGAFCENGPILKGRGKSRILHAAVTVAITYDPFGPVTALEHGNGLDLTRSFDLDGRITDILTTDGLTPVQDLDYGYDNANGITSITDNLTAARSETFAYNNRRRLSDADGLYGDIDYVYDAVGNRTSRVTFDGLITITDSYTLASTSNRLSSTTDGSTTRSFTYSATGAVTEDDRGASTPYTLIYNDEDRLVEIKQGTTTLATYAHNDLGERVIKTAGSATTHYHYDQAGRLIAESDGTGAVQREVIYLGDLPIAQVDSTGVSAQLYRIHADHIGTPRRMTDSSKAVVWDAVFKPFGEVQSLTGTATNDNRFQGQRYDSVAGYHYNYLRDYDSRLGRYLQSDPIGLDGGLNTYAYVDGNPIQRVDPTGEFGLPGGLGELGWELAGQLSRNGGNPSCLNYGALAGAFILGAINPASSLKWLGRLKELAKFGKRGGDKGGLNLHRFGHETATRPDGWKEGDRFLILPDRGSPRANWKQNSSRLREEMRRGEPIYDSHRTTSGAQIPSGQTPTSGGRFLRAERNLLESRGWRYNSQTGAYHPPAK